MHLIIGFLLFQLVSGTSELNSFLGERWYAGTPPHSSKYPLQTGSLLWKACFLREQHHQYISWSSCNSCKWNPIKILDHVVPPTQILWTLRGTTPHNQTYMRMHLLAPRKGLTFWNLHVRSLLRKIDDVRHWNLAWCWHRREWNLYSLITSTTDMTRRKTNASMVPPKMEVWHSTSNHVSIPARLAWRARAHFWRFCQ